jgi:hypothetical protein
MLRFATASSSSWQASQLPNAFLLPKITTFQAEISFINRSIKFRNGPQLTDVQSLPLPQEIFDI